MRWRVAATNAGPPGAGDGVVAEGRDMARKGSPIRLGAVSRARGGEPVAERGQVDRGQGRSPVSAR